MNRFIIPGFILLIFYLFSATSALCSVTHSPVYIRKADSSEHHNFPGDNQLQTVNRQISSPLRVVVTDEMNKPIPDFPVYFKFVSSPPHANGYFIDPTVQKTGSNGIASVYVKLGSEQGEYEISAYIKENSENNFVLFKLFAHKSNWVFKLIVGLIGGLGLFLLGMTMMSQGLQKSAGDKMRSILSTLTYNRFIAVLVGTFVTMIIQSSSATLVMLVSFVNSRLLRFRQTIGIFLGAAIGTTITVQIIAFKITDYALLMIGIGFFITILFKNQVYKNIGESILGFGVLFFGMHIMSEAMYPLHSYEGFINILIKLENPLLGIVAGALLTALIQSSGAFIGIMIILASQGFLSLEAAIPLLIGSNIGTAITAILASIHTNRESKQVALAFTIFKASGALILIWWIPGFSQLIEKISPGIIDSSGSIDEIAKVLPRQIANAHTIYNIMLVLIFLPFIKSYSKIIQFIFPARLKQLDIFQTKYLDENTIKTPLLALNLAKQEVQRMIKVVKQMTEVIIIPFKEKNMTVLQAIEKYESQVNFLRDSITDYLLKITRQNVDARRVEEAFQMLYTVKEFEQIGDIISNNLKEKAMSWCKSNYEFSEPGMNELLKCHQLTLKQINRAYKLYMDFSLKRARKMKNKYEEYRNITFELEKQHFERLKNQVEESVSSSNTHLELITMFKMIGSHSTNIARGVLTEKK